MNDVEDFGEQEDTGRVPTVSVEAYAPRRDQGIYRYALIVLGIVALMGMGGAIWLALIHPDKEIPDTISNLASASVGAIAGLLAGAKTSE
ncbi:MAG: hypothetical protein GY706_03695 [Bacteroides sp.]|nr:hypothetical protein [Bacteroides sp.]